jgi:hypothetical protein
LRYTNELPKIDGTVIQSFVYLYTILVSAIMPKKASHVLLILY